MTSKDKQKVIKACWKRILSLGGVYVDLSKKKQSVKEQLMIEVATLSQLEDRQHVWTERDLER